MQKTAATRRITQRRAIVFYRRSFRRWESPRLRPEKVHCRHGACDRSAQRESHVPACRRATPLGRESRPFPEADLLSVETGNIFGILSDSHVSGASFASRSDPISDCGGWFAKIRGRRNIRARLLG